MSFRVLTLSALFAASIVCTEQTAKGTTTAAADGPADVLTEPTVLPATLARSASTVGAMVFFITPGGGDTGLPDLGLPIPADAHHVHFSDGSTATEITLEPGAYTLRMQLGDYLHIPHDPPLASEVITVTVE